MACYSIGRAIPAVRSFITHLPCRWKS
jgi:hypothetical protein